MATTPLFLMNKNVGIALTEYCCATSGTWSTSTRTKAALVNSRLSSLKRGAMAWQGPIHRVMCAANFLTQGNSPMTECTEDVPHQVA